MISDMLRFTFKFLLDHFPPCFSTETAPKYSTSQTTRSRVGEAGGYKCNQDPAVAVLGRRLNEVMKLAWRGEDDVRS